MKLKHILTLLLVVTLSHQSMAQRRHKPSPRHQTSVVVAWESSIDITYGIAAGVTIPNVTISGNDASVSANPGFKIGGMWGIGFGTFDVTAELWYSTFKINFDKDGAGLKGAELKNSTFDFPILAGFDLTDRLKLQLGPSFSLMSNNSLTLKNGESYEFGSIKNSVGYVAGLSYNLVSNFVIDLRYSGRFAASSNEFYSNTDPYTIRMSTIDITAGFRF